jgi:ribonuclease HI
MTATLLAMWVTCYTDASFVPRRGGRWAVWLRCDSGRLKRSGACSDAIRTSTNAELAAIAAGIQLALRTWGGTIRGIEVRCDCRAALAIAEGSGRARNPTAQQLHNRIQRQLREYDVTLKCGWVKAHQPSGASRAAFLNNQCDAMARGRRRR